MTRYRCVLSSNSTAYTTSSAPVFPVTSSLITCISPSWLWESGAARLFLQAENSSVMTVRGYMPVFVYSEHLQLDPLAGPGSSGSPVTVVGSGFGNNPFCEFYSLAEGVKISASASTNFISSTKIRCSPPNTDL